MSPVFTESLPTFGDAFGDPVTLLNDRLPGPFSLRKVGP